MSKSNTWITPVWLTRFKVIWQQATSLFDHIRQVAARVANLRVWGAF